MFRLYLLSASELGLAITAYYARSRRPAMLRTYIVSPLCATPAHATSAPRSTPTCSANKSLLWPHDNHSIKASLSGTIATGFLTLNNLRQKKTRHFMYMLPLIWSHISMALPFNILQKKWSYSRVSKWHNFLTSHWLGLCLIYLLCPPSKNKCYALHIKSFNFFHENILNVPVQFIYALVS